MQVYLKCSILFLNIGKLPNKYKIKHLSSKSPMTKYRVVMMRHGTSEWNDDNRFCGWANVPLSEKGIQQAINAAQLLKDAKLKFDIAFTTGLIRAQKTLEIILEQLDITHIPVIKSWRLNERHYGALTGMNRLDTVEKYGMEQVKIWRRSYDVPPPPMEEDHPYYKAILNDQCFVAELPKDQIPLGESMKMACERIIPYWNEHVVPKIKNNEHVLLVLHGTTCRAIMKHLANISDEDIKEVNVPTGIPFQLHLNEDMRAASEMVYLGDQDLVKKAMKEVEDQIKKK